MPRSANDKTIDLAGVACAFALAEIVRAVADRGGPVEAICDHPTTVHETIPQYCKAHGYRLTVTPEIYPLDSHTYRMRIEPPNGG
jgi:TusA-related sulfurtransferase